MPRLESFRLKIKTGEKSFDGPLKYSINGFPLDFEEVQGGTGAGETAEVMGEPQSFPHTLQLIGPESGEWEIETIEATYHCQAEPPYSVHFGKVVLDDSSDLNIWHPRPPKVVDV